MITRLLSLSLRPRFMCVTRRAICSGFIAAALVIAAVTTLVLTTAARTSPRKMSELCVKTTYTPLPGTALATACGDQVVRCCLLTDICKCGELTVQNGKNVYNLTAQVREAVDGSRRRLEWNPSNKLRFLPDDGTDGFRYRTTDCNDCWTALATAQNPSWMCACVKNGVATEDWIATTVESPLGFVAKRYAWSLPKMHLWSNTNKGYTIAARSHEISIVWRYYGSVVGIYTGFSAQVVFGGGSSAKVAVRPGPEWVNWANWQDVVNHCDYFCAL